MNNELHREQPSFTTDKLRKYPHMFALDIDIWERFLDAHGGDFIGFDYDVKVGSGTEPVEGLRDRYRRMQEILSKYRIDAVGYTDDAIYIIEVKPDASTIAIGQIDTYTRLYRRDINPSRRIVGAIVTNREVPDMRFLTNEKRIMYYIV